MALPLTRLRVVIPVFNDWESLGQLLEALDKLAGQLSCRISVSVVDDGSTIGADGIFEVATKLCRVSRVELVRLAVNVGHQRAIAVGLCRGADLGEDDAILVMDSDGEDRPEAIPLLLERAADKGDFCIVAARQKRSENFTFKASYIIYKTIFKLVTGKKINFGNFSLISSQYVSRLVMIPDLWNNLAAALLRSRLPIDEVLIDRGKRYAGKSKMNFTSLVVHGFSAISVYSDTIFVRLLIGTLGLVGLTTILVTTVLFLRAFLPAHATPGWATTVTFGMVIILLQALFTTLTSLLGILSGRVQRLTLPIMDYKPYVRKVEVVFPVGTDA